MFRAVLYIFLAIILISLLRTIIEVVRKGVSALFEPEPKEPEPGQAPTVGELKRDPICGTYVSTAVSVKRTVEGQVLHFCSRECAEKHRG